MSQQRLRKEFSTLGSPLPSEALGANCHILGCAGQPGLEGRPHILGELGKARFRVLPQPTRAADAHLD